jgi:hypothetical protein
VEKKYMGDIQQEGSAKECNTLAKKDVASNLKGKTVEYGRDQR